MVPSFQPSLPVPLPSESRLAVEAEAQSSEPPVTASVPSRPDPLDTQLLVIQLDPVAMVRNLDLDEEATRAAEELATKTQKYLVAISMGLDLIFADSKWCRYMVLPVATSFRPACPELGITSDMVLPIPPNSAAGKTSTHSDDADATEVFNFPFGNCYFWVYSATLLRIHLRRGNDSFDITNAIKVPMSLETRLHALRRLRSSASGPFPPPSFIQSFDYYPIVPPDPFAYVDKSTWVAAAKAMAEEFTAPDLEDSDSEESDSDDSESDSDSDSDGLNSDSGSGSDGSNSDSGSGSDSDSEAVLGFLRLFNAFGLNDHDPVTGYTPLFHAWPEVDQHLQEGTIGSPAMLWREQHVISLIIREGLSRRASASAQENTN